MTDDTEPTKQQDGPSALSDGLEFLMMMPVIQTAKQQDGPSALSDGLGRLVKDQMNLYFGSPMPEDLYHEFHSTVGEVYKLCLYCARAGALHHAATLAAKDKEYLDSLL